MSKIFSPRTRRRAPPSSRAPSRVYRTPAGRGAQGLRTLLRAPPAAQRACVDCEEEKNVRRAATSPTARGGDVSATVAAGTASGGAPLPAAARHHFEPRFGHDFGGVRVHTDSQAAASARELSAHAYTFGPDVVFGAGRYDPGGVAGRRLLAHELAHVVQQGSTPSLERVVRRDVEQPAAAKPASEVTTTYSFPGCSMERCAGRESAIEADVARAHSYTARAISALEGKVSDSTERLLDWYFNDHGESTVKTVRERLICTQGALQDTLQNKRYVCSTREAPIALTGGADAWCQDSKVPICLYAPYFGQSARGRATAMVHECGHRIGLSSGGLDLPDIYSREWAFLQLGNAKALVNTDSYALFAGAVAHGAPVTIMPLLGGQGGVTSSGGRFLKFRAGFEFQHPSLRGINPSVGLTLGVLESMPVASVFVGARLGDARPGRKWNVYLDASGGLSFVGGDSLAVGAEAEARLGLRIGTIDVGLTGGVLRDRSPDAGARTVYTGGLAVSWIPEFWSK